MLTHAHDTQRTLSCKVLAREPDPVPNARELGELLNASIRKATGQMPFVQDDPHAEIRKLYERAAVDFLRKLRIDLSGC